MLAQPTQTLNQSSHLSLFWLAMGRACSVATFMSKSSIDLNFRQPLSQQALTKISELKYLTQDYTMSDTLDRRYRKWLPKHSFIVSSCYRFLKYGSIILHLKKIIWKFLIPKKCKIFNWLCNNNRLSIIEVLAKKGLSGPSRCALCYIHEKIFNHLFLECRFSKSLWEHILRCCGSSALPRNLHDFWFNWRNAHGLSKHLMASDMMAATICCTLWKEQNN